VDIIGFLTYLLSELQQIIGDSDPFSEAPKCV